MRLAFGDEQHGEVSTLQNSLRVGRFIGQVHQLHRHLHQLLEADVQRLLFFNVAERSQVDMAQVLKE